MGKKASNIVRYVLWGAVAAVLLYFSFRGVDWDAFLEALRYCRWEYVLASMVLGALVLLIRGLRWRMLLLPVDPSIRIATAWNAYNICMLVDLVLPRVGEVVRCGYVVRHSSRDAEGKRRATLDKVLGTVAMDRLWDAIALAVILVLLLTMRDGRFNDFFRETFAAGSLGRAALWWTLAGVAVLLAAALFLFWRMREKGGFWAKAWKVVLGIGEGFSSCLRMRHGFLFIVFTALIWVLYTLMCACIVWSLQGVAASVPDPEQAAGFVRLGNLGMADAMLLMFAGSLSSLVPVPGGFGAYHSVVALCLQSIYGVPFAVGILFATLSHESQILANIVCGGVSYISETVRK